MIVYAYVMLTVPDRISCKWKERWLEFTVETDGALSDTVKRGRRRIALFLEVHDRRNVFKRMYVVAIIRSTSFVQFYTM